MKRYLEQRDELASPLHQERLEKVVQSLLRRNVQSVLDLGCGGGELLARLSAERAFTKIIGIDSSLEALASAKQLLGINELCHSDGRLFLYHASFTSFLSELAGCDAAVMLETIEHIDPNRLSTLEKTIFVDYHPKTVLITTPNFEYNPLHGIPEGAFRHADHRFEWTRPKFRKWAAGVAGRNGYRVLFDDIGPGDPELGSSTQMAIFTTA